MTNVAQVADRRFSGDDHRTWWLHLLAGQVCADTAAEVGECLGRLHRFGSDHPELAAHLVSDDVAPTTQVEACFETLVRVHRDLRVPIMRTVEMTRESRSTFVHGDVTPANIMLGPAGPMLLPPRGAHWDDPALDVASCVSHLVLMCLIPQLPIDDLLTAVRHLVVRYVDSSGAPDCLERRIVRLLPILMLAAVDGPEPMECLSDRDRALVRGAARRIILRRIDTIEAVCATWKDMVR